MKKVAHKKRRLKRSRMVVRTICLPKPILDTGLSAAEKQRRPFSNYVAGLIEQDAAQAGEVAQAS